MTSTAELLAHWVANDPNPLTRNYFSSPAAQQKDAASDAAFLAKSMGPRIAFGTAGLRALMRPGYAYMNDLTVLQTTLGLIEYLREACGAAGSSSCSSSSGMLSVVIGFDHRAAVEFGITSRSLATLSAGAFLEAGFQVHLFSGYVATPLVPFSVRRLGASCGIMFTASHNPKEYNGMKIYGGNGCLIVAPTDTAVSAAILRNLDVAKAHPKYYCAASDPSALAKSVHCHPCMSDPTSTIFASYNDCVQRMAANQGAGAGCAAASKYGGSQSGGSVPRFVYTAMHGVATPFILAAFAAASLPAPDVVVAQCSPDPAFPTVWFPNPEEGASVLKMAFAEGDRVGAHVMIASDPDGDRLAAAERQVVDAASGRATWRVFTGNEIGVLLCDFVHSAAARAQSVRGVPNVQLVALNTVVSSGLLSAWGAHVAKPPVKVEQTLTGFKNLGNKTAAVNGARRLYPEPHDQTASQHQQQQQQQQLQLLPSEAHVFFAYEEAIGFMVDPENTSDKDGITAAVSFAMMARKHYAAGFTLEDRLRAIWMQAGYFKQNNGYVSTESQGTGYSARVFARIQNYHAPGVLPQSIANMAVLEATQTASDMFQFKIDCAPLARSLDPTARMGLGPCAVTLRSSGTEPKIKYYTEVQVLWAADAPPMADESEQLGLMDKLAEKVLTKIVDAIVSDWIPSTIPN